uniref:Uncharacterized protein n=1 Tax=Setaria italica TaxID=4555 RepID=K3Y3X8_SETIT
MAQGDGSHTKHLELPEKDGPHAPQAAARRCQQPRLQRFIANTQTVQQFTRTHSYSKPATSTNSHKDRPSLPSPATLRRLRHDRIHAVLFVS